MARVYKTEVWEACLPEGWQAKEIDGQAHVAFFRPDATGEIEVIATDDEERSDQHLHCNFPETNTEVADFHGRLPGRTRAWTYENSACRMWKLFFPGGTLYVRYRCAAKNRDWEGLEVEAIVRSLSGSYVSVIRADAVHGPQSGS